MNAYGKRGGTSAVAGKKAVIYEATLPDGQVVRKRSFYVNQESAVLGCYQHDGKWYASGIVDSPKAWGGQSFVEAKRI